MSSANDWAEEDDAWDSGSDSESKAGPATAKVKSPSHSITSNSSSASSKATKPIAPSIPHLLSRPDPIPISPPRKTSLTGGNRHRDSPSSNSTNGANHSSGSVNNLSFSFTHVSHPSPSSYPPASNLSSHPESDDADWQEQERDERERAGWTIVRSDDGPSRAIAADDEPDAELDGSMVVGAMDPVMFDTEDSDDEPVKQGAEAVLTEAEDVVKGMFLLGMDTIKPNNLTLTPDPMFAVRKSQLSIATGSPIGLSSRSNSPSLPPGQTRSQSNSETRLSRGRSLRSSRKYGKVVECLGRPDVNMSEFTQDESTPKTD